MTVLPQRDLAGVIEAFPALRQSLLGDFDSCRLATRWSLEGVPSTNPAQARGILFHRFAGEVLRTLSATGETSIPVAEALEILYEVCAQRDVPDAEVVLCPAEERRLLRILAIKFVTQNVWQMDRLMAIEERLYADVDYVGPTGDIVTRRITGQPDALLADPPDGLIVLDWKTTQSPPPEYRPRDGVERYDHGRGLSYLGYFQQRVYALLALHRYPAASSVTLREYYPLKDATREATVLRVDLEHIERELALLAELLDRALMGGSSSGLWQPTAGRHCGWCPRPGDCPLSAQVRLAEGGITSEDQARQAAAQYVLATRDKDLLTTALKSWVEDHGPVPVKSGKGRYEVRWKYSATSGSRSFGLHVPDVSDRGPVDPVLDRTFEALQERVEL